MALNGGKVDEQSSVEENDREREEEAARTEAPQERIDRQVNERAERVARAPKPAPVPKSDPAPAPAPAPTPAPVSVAGMLADLDKELRSNVAAPCQAYAEMRDDLAQRYLAECKKEEEKGVQAGNLDLVLLWQAEARALTGGGDAPREDSGAPPRANALRKGWRTRMDPLSAELAPMQSAYLAQCSELANAADSEEAKGMLAARGELVAKFENFWALCAGPRSGHLPSTSLVLRQFGFGHRQRRRHLPNSSHSLRFPGPGKDLEGIAAYPLRRMGLSDRRSAGSQPLRNRFPS